MMGKVNVVHPGMYTTIQDLGRFGFSKYGIPKSGAMDQEAMAWANLILGNRENDAVLEWTMQAPVLQFSAPTYICVTGGNVTVFLNEDCVGCYVPIPVRTGDIIRIENTSKIVYGYIGITQGFQSEKVFKSRSWYIGITKSYRLSKNEELLYFKHHCLSPKGARLHVKSDLNPSIFLTVFKGVEFDMLSAQQQKNVLESTFTLSNTRNRMAIQLVEPLENDLPAIVTSAVLPGTVQLTPSGQLIVLMRDCQTTGGYPRILQLTEKAMNSIAQKWVGEEIRFRITDL